MPLCKHGRGVLELDLISVTYNVLRSTTAARVSDGSATARFTPTCLAARASVASSNVISGAMGLGTVIGYLRVLWQIAYATWSLLLQLERALRPWSATHEEP